MHYQQSNQLNLVKQIYSKDNESEKYQKLAIQIERVSAVVNEPITSCQ